MANRWIGGSVEVFVGSCCGKEEAKNQVVGSYHGKGEEKDRLWKIGGSVL